MTAEGVKSWKRSRVAGIVDVCVAGPVGITEERQTVPDIDRSWQAVADNQPSIPARLLVIPIVVLQDDADAVRRWSPTRRSIAKRSNVRS